jgi:hypothetical protein
MTASRVAMLAILAGGLAAPAVAQPARQAIARSPGFDQGYTRGVDAGAEDRRRGEPFNFIDERDYRSGDDGYRREYGRRDAYADDFRRGYQAGYRQGYERGPVPRGGNGRPPVWSNGNGPVGGPGNGRGGAGRGRGLPGQRVDLAWENGYLDGYEAGLDDGEDRDRFDPVGERRYRSADHGYDRRYGPLELYKNRYRPAFRDGYEEGYADGRRYGRGLRSDGARPWWWPW